MTFVAHFFLTFLLSFANADTPMPKLGWQPHCIDQTIRSKHDPDSPVSIDNENLGCLKTAVEARLLRQIFDDVSRGKKPLPKINLMDFIGRKKFVKLLRRPILVFNISTGELAGYHVRFIFKDYPRDEFNAWFTFEDDESYKLEIVVDSGPPERDAKKIKRLHKKEFQVYWL